MIVDSHQHFWDLARGANDWITDDIWQIRRDYFPAHLGDYLKHLGIDKTILVEASAETGENTFMAAMAEKAGFVGGIVGWIDLDDAGAEAQLQQMGDLDLFKGVRPAISLDPARPPVMSPKFVQNAKAIAAQGMAMDAMAHPHLLPFYTELASAIPDLRIVVDHCAKPVIGGGQDAGDGWRRDMAEIATRPNVYCKLSGITQEYGTGWSRAALQPVFDHVLTHFGPNRIMWGSDWPVLEMTASYTQWFDAMRGLIAGLSDAEQSEILGGTACRFYRV